jgi:protease-4
MLGNALVRPTKLTKKRAGGPVILFPFRYLWWLIKSARRSLGKPPDFVLFVIEGEMPPLPDPPRPIWQRFTSRPRLSVKELGERLEAIGRDPRIRGVVLHLRPLALPMAGVEDLREHVAGLRRAGKRVVAWAPFYTTGTYFLACACDEVLIMPAGMVRPLGFAGTGMFLADGLARFGIAADFAQVSPYKSAADILTKSKMSNEYRDQVTWLLESRHGELLKAIGDSRHLDEGGARGLIDATPCGDEAALAAHAVDGIVSEEDLTEHLSSRADSAVTLGTWERAQGSMQTPPPSLGLGQYVALLRIEGTIVDGRSGRLPVPPPVEVPFLGEDRAGDLTIVQAARLVAADKRAAAVVLYVNSRGGSATASEAMRQALAVVASRKPLVVVMGPAAGSGGYWVATPASWIVARPSTLTGSIGVLTGKLVTSGIWSKLLFNRETIAFGKHATIDSDDRAYTDEERRIVEDEINRIYRLFVDIVARARRMTPSDVLPIAEGKVWSGRQALERKLVDELGGLETATSKARSLAKLPDEVPLREVRAPKRAVAPLPGEAAGGWPAYLIQSLTMLAHAPALAVMEYVPAEPR